MLQVAGAAVSRGVAGVSHDASMVAASSIGAGDQVLPALLDSRQQVLYTQAAAKMLDTANQLMGTIVDIHA
jgi:hypothetical protein